jgi:glycosyltransferase involved in cell wall biosynthesis
MLASAYAACEVFVLPSLFETPGIAALEAGLAGAKIVITPHGGTRDYFGLLAQYVDPFSVESIRIGILSALSANRTDTLQHHIKKEFLWSTTAEKTLAVYQRVLSH